MSMIQIKSVLNNGQIKIEELDVYCNTLSKKNNSVLFKLEKYLNKKLLSDPDLIEIRDTILTVSGELNRLNDCLLTDGDSIEGLQ
ncbi:hypothetical protein HRF59_05945 [Bacillus velezensis]|uniref:hypothetical protein n=1 Tax=Bacillus amyloliquefaciens group TaxID=1938374 RepID=UPI001404C97B|nr:MULTISPECIES: hypothetical protein [Bacillus amyloliquefaciens group]MCA1233361.1 hypothetical protein [Bacillus velezensis]MCA1311461.1 hypothetical protein [Bacillus velezensis]MCA1330302.1 hypothetical protein [Bacillus velezensis]NHN20891.1 hypothetical protein [Bacillus amyloliquefaciens]NMP64161.1 hypothetical protein [Bacillus velezensis]